MHQPATTAMFQYWNELRDGRPAPLRSEIEPSDIKHLLADAFILETDSRGSTFRLAGTRLCATFGRELKGFSFPSIWRPKDMGIINRSLASVARDFEIVVIGFRGRSQLDRTAEFELILLPLDVGVESSRQLGLVTPCERCFWLGAEPIVEVDILSVRTVDPNLQPLYLRNRPAVTFPQPDPANLPALDSYAQARRVRHLVVYQGGLEH